MKNDTTNDNRSNVLEDRIFKKIFSNQRILEDFLKSIFEYMGIKEEAIISRLEPHTVNPSDKKEKKDYYSDLVIVLQSGAIVNLEAYSRYTKDSYKKGLCYLSRLYSNQMGRGNKKYRTCNKVYSINIVNHYKKTTAKDPLHRYIYQDIISSETLYDGETQMIFIALDKLDEYMGEEKRMIKWLRWINAKNDEERNKISEGDETMIMASEILDKYTKIRPMTEEEYYARRIEDEVAFATCEVEENYIIAMLQNNLSIGIIKNITGMRESEIREIAAEHDIVIDENK